MNKRTITALALSLFEISPCSSSYMLEDSFTSDPDHELNLSNSQIKDSDFLFRAGSPPERYYTNIDVSQNPITGLSFIKISTHKTLTSLNLACTKIELNDLAQLSVLLNLITLDLSNCPQFNGDVSRVLRENVSELPLESLYLNNLNDQCFLKLEDFFSEPTQHRNFRKLTLLSIHNAQLDNRSICGLKLEKLYANGVQIIQVSEFITKETRTYIKTPPKKKEIIEQPTTSQSNVKIAEFVISKRKKKLIDSDTPDINIEIIEDYSNPKFWYHYIASGRRFIRDKIETLTELSLANCKLFDDNIKSFETLKSLVYLNLSHNYLSQISLTYFASLTLEHLDLGHNRITETEVRDILHPRTKQFLQHEYIQNKLIFSTSLRTLVLDGNPITGSCIRSLLSLPKLNILSLKGIDFIDGKNRALVMHVILGSRTDLNIYLSSHLKQYDTEVKITHYSPQLQSNHIIFKDD